MLKEEANEKAADHYLTKLKSKGLEGWILYRENKMKRNEDMGVLVEAIEKMHNEKTMSKALAMWKLYKEESVGFILNVRTVFAENSLRRVLMYWKQFSDMKKHERTVLENYQEYKDKKDKIEYLQRWKDVFRTKVVLEKFAGTVSKYYMKNCLVEVIEHSNMTHMVRGHQDYVMSNVKAKFWLHWIEYTLKSKQYRAKVQAIEKRHTVNQKKNCWKLWRKFYHVNIMRENRLRQQQINAFYALVEYAQTQRRYKEISHVIHKRSLKKYFKALLMNQESNVIGKVMLRNKHIQKERAIKQKAAYCLSIWRKNAQTIAFYENRALGAEEHSRTTLLKKYFMVLRNYYRQMSIAREFSDRMLNIQYAITPKINKARAFSQLKRHGQVLNKTEEGIERLEIVLKKSAHFFEKLMSNTLQKNKYLLLSIKAEAYLTKALQRQGFYKLQVYQEIYERYQEILAEVLPIKQQQKLAQTFNVLKLFAHENKMTRINSEKATQFLFEKCFVNLQRSVFANWKNYIKNEKIVFDDRVQAMQEKLTETRTKEFFNLLKKKTDKNKKIKTVMNLENPVFKNFVEQQKIRTLKNFFLEFKSITIERRDDRKRHESIINHIQQSQQNRLLKEYFTELNAHYKEEKNKATRSKLHSIFYSWKLFAKERSLLKKYLKESNINEEYAYTPHANRKRNDEDLRMTVSSMNFSGLSSAMSNYQHENNFFTSPVNFDSKDFKF